MPLDYDLLVEAKTARVAFFICSLAAFGSAATGRIIIPNSIKQWEKYASLVGKGESEGGEEMDFFGYPEPIYKNDVMKVLNNELSPLMIAEQFPVEGTYQGALHADAMGMANEGTSQMAVRAVFDAMALGINKNQINPMTAEFKIQRYKMDLDLLQEDNKKGRTVGLLALGILLALLGAADYFAVFHGLHGWFPMWEGFAEFPSSLFDERGFKSLTGCYMWDLPE